MEVSQPGALEALLARGVCKFVFMGPSGSGKSLLALNTALRLAPQSTLVPHYLDMDQTKPLYRARDAAALLAQNGIALHFAPQVLDAPVTLPAVQALLENPRNLIFLDVGGNLAGAVHIGQYAADWRFGWRRRQFWTHPSLLRRSFSQRLRDPCLTDDPAAGTTI